MSCVLCPCFGNPQIADVLAKNTHYSVNEKDQMVIMTDRGYGDCEKMLGKSMFDATDPWAPYIMNAIKAKELFKKDTSYIIRDGTVQVSLAQES